MGPLRTNFYSEIALGLGLLALSGCSQMQDVPRYQEKYTYMNSFSNFQLEIPKDYKHTTVDDEGVFFGYDKNEGDFSIQVYTPEGSRDTKACDAMSTGSRQVTSIEKVGNETFYARVPIMNMYDRVLNLYCPEATDGCTQEQVFDGTCKTQAAMYAFCSESRGKAVVMCIHQQTDNPQLAEEIFNTFRWTD